MDTEMALSRKINYFQLIRLACSACAIEMVYATESAFVTPLLLTLGIPVYLATLVWIISPVIGFFLTPLYGSLSDTCTSPLGRRRPFILITGICMLTGMLLVENGRGIGILLGDTYHLHETNITANYNIQNFNDNANSTQKGCNSSTYQPEFIETYHYHNPWGIVITIFGVAMMDSNCDICQSPSRALMFDVTHPDFHSRGLNVFTVMAGLAGILSFSLGFINWKNTLLGKVVQDSTVIGFGLVIILSAIFLTIGVTSVKEVPYKKTNGKSKRKAVEDGILNQDRKDNNVEKRGEDNDGTSLISSHGSKTNYDSIHKISYKSASTDKEQEQMTFKSNLISICYMPKQIAILYLNCVFAWLAVVNYFFYFSTFIGEGVYKGQPTATGYNQEAVERYEDGVRWASLSEGFYCLSCTIFSLCMENIINKLGMRAVYLSIFVMYFIAALIMAFTLNRWACLFLSVTPGLLYAANFNIPFTLVSHYHTIGLFKHNGMRPRGLGTDVSIITSSVFIAQILLSSIMGTLIHVFGPLAIMYVAAIFTALAFITAMFVHYEGL